MFKNIYKYLAIIACITFMQPAALPQEFSVAAGVENTYSGGGACDNTNYLLSIVNIVDGQYNIELQLIGPGPALIGSRILTGKTGSGTKLAFDGTNYLMVWTDPFPFFAGGDTNGIGNLYGQFINTSGQLLGSTFNIANDINIKFGQGRGTFTFNDTTYLVTYVKGGHHQDYLYGQYISKSGALLGSPLKISSNYARDHSISYDGENCLIAWCEGSGVDEYIYGQFISGSQAQLVGSNFLIDGSTNKSDNPLAMAYNEADKYFVLFHDQASGDYWNIYGKFVSKTGEVSADRILICDETQAPMVPSIAWKSPKYLITWMETKDKMIVKGRFYDANASPVADEFIAFDTLDGKSAIGGVGGVVPDHFLMGAIRVDSLFTDADVYVKVLDVLTGIEGTKDSHTPLKFKLNQNYPNPFNPSTIIKYELPKDALVTMKLFDLLGREIKTLVSEEKPAGSYSYYLDASGLATGVYFYWISAGNYLQTKKMILLK